VAHFAKISAGVVTEVIVVSTDVCPDPAPDNENKGQAFIASLGLPGEWRQTSYNGNFRKQYAGPSFTYDADADVFIAPQPYPSWTLDGNHDWQPPTPMPNEGGPWSWDEDTLAWIDLSAN
jgi:hypothetical protein